MNIKNILISAVMLLPTLAVEAQVTSTAKPLPTPIVGYENRITGRSEFSSHTMRANSDKNDRTGEWNYIYIKDFKTSENNGTKLYTAQVEIPTPWVDRIVVLHSEGGRNSHRIIVNGKQAGSSRDSGTPSEFDITPYLISGINTLTIEVPEDTPEPETGLKNNRPDIETWFLYSQPRNRVIDYRVSSKVTGNDGEGELILDVVVRNDYRVDETFTVGFDIFNPSGKLEEYGMKEITLPGMSCDTVRLRAKIYGAGKRMWSAENPNIYNVTVFIGKGGRMLEYVPMNVGFGNTSYADGAISRNGKQITIKHKSYNSSTPAALRKDITAFKKSGFNTLIPDYPQPYWFYDICDETGMYVIDQANINTSYETDNMRIGGTISNDPAWLPEYLVRTQAMYYRSLNHPCIIAWSLGGDSGNGYNLYKTYLWLKSVDPSRAVIYRGANGEWNNDITLK